MSTEESLLSHYGGLQTNSLNHVLNADIDNDDEQLFSSIIKHSPYFYWDQFITHSKQI